MDLAASVSEGPLLREAGSCIHITPESRGMHQTVIVEANVHLPRSMLNFSAFDVLSVFLIPGGLYVDEYEMQRLLSGSDPPIRIHSMQDSALYEEVHNASSPSSFTVFVVESFSVPKSPGSTWSYSWHLAVHLQYTARPPGNPKPVLLRYPFLYLRPSSERPSSSGRCVGRSYLGRAEKSATGQFSDCIDLEALLTSLEIQSTGKGKMWYQYDGRLTQPNLANGYMAIASVQHGGCNVSFGVDWITGGQDESVHLLTSLVLLTTAAFLLVFLLKL